MAPTIFLLLSLGLTASLVSGLIIRKARDVSGSATGAGAGSFASAGSSSGSFSSSTGTKVAPGPGGYGNFNAFAANTNLNRFADEGALPRPALAPTPFPFFFPTFNPFVPQYGQQYPFTPFPTFAPFDFSSFLNNYFQQLHQFQSQAEVQAQQAAASGYPTETNEVGAGGIASYSPQGGYGSASVYPALAGGLETRFGGDAGPANTVGGGPVSSVSGSFGPPGSNSYGVFTSSMSGSSDINGKKTSFKQSTVGVNDNGKVTTYTAHDP